VIVANQTAGQQASFDKNLKTVADAQNGEALLGLCNHLRHDRGVCGNGPAPKVITVTEATRKYQSVNTV
jgi:hypothetical protein